ncbi:MmcQ/YjbR family DNA-binding protein [Aliiglaciecola litoralis]|uniref:MmcQ/YjbR family DNA-binding protein n=1 Tax=Aliiglaciecola litoralis TaxID=582857 RepID=A0ABP3X0B5_9ALTE
MNIEQVKSYLLSKPESVMDFPFGPDVAVFKVKHKMFATLGEEDGEGRMNLKCDPHEALLLREMFVAVKPGYHMNKKHWNTLYLDDSIPQGELERMMDNSFLLVVNKMPKKEQQSILIHL